MATDRCLMRPMDKFKKAIVRDKEQILFTHLVKNRQEFPTIAGSPMSLPFLLACKHSAIKCFMTLIDCFAQFPIFIIKEIQLGGILKKKKGFLKLEGLLLEPDENGMTCLHFACKSGCSQIVIKLLQFSAISASSFINRKDVFSRTALDYSSQKGASSVTAALLQTQANISHLNPLFLAAKNGHSNIVDLILRGSDDKMEYAQKLSVISLADQAKWKEILQVCLYKGEGLIFEKIFRAILRKFGNTVALKFFSEINIQGIKTKLAMEGREKDIETLGCCEKFGIFMLNSR